MYKKYINKKGKKVGPYYYDSIRLKNGKIKSVYLGSDLKKAKKKLILLKKEQSKKVHLRSSATLKKTLKHKSKRLNPRSNYNCLKMHEMDFGERVALSGILILMLLSFVHFGGLLVEQQGMVVGKVVELTGGNSGNLLTGNVIFTSEETFLEHSESLNLIVEESADYGISFGGVDRLNSVKISGDYVLGDEGVVKVFLSDVDSSDSYLIFDSDSKKERKLDIFRGVTGFVVDAMEEVGGVVEEPSYNELYDKGLISGFAVVNNKGVEVNYELVYTENKSKVELIDKLVTEVVVDQTEDGWFGYQEYSSRGLLEPENISFKQVFGFDFSFWNVSNKSEISFSSDSNGDYLYGCNFWDFEFGICLTDWIYLSEINNTPNYTSKLTKNFVAFAEGVFDPNKSIKEIVEVPVVIEEVIEVIELSDMFGDYLEENNFTEYLRLNFTNACRNTCRLSEIVGSNVKLKIYLKNAVLNLKEIKIEAEENNVSDYSFKLTNELGEVLSKSEINIDKNVTGVKSIEIKPGQKEEVIQYGAVIGKPVKWKKKILLNKSAKLEVEVPIEATNVTVTKFVAGVEEEVLAKLEVSEGVFESIGDTEKSSLLSGMFSGGNMLTGMAVGDLVEEILEKTYTLDEEGHINETKTLVVEELVEAIEIEYETPGPEAYVEATDDGKRILVTSETHYENILAFIDIPETDLAKIEFYRVVDGTRVIHEFDGYDTNDNGLVDYVEWVVPSLSNDTYEIVIEIINAEHLDSNREFISDIFSEVSKRDDVWSEAINDGEHVRIKFEKQLDSKKDITLYPWILNGTPSIEVYEINSNQLLTEFKSLTNNKLNKVYLTSLERLQDRFDLKVVGGSVKFDYIVDPSPSSDFFIQRGTTIMSSGSLTATITEGTDFAKCASSTNCFIKMVSSRHSGMGKTSGGGNQNLDDFNVYVSDDSGLITSSGTVTFTRKGSANNNRFTWEIWEYIGPSSANNEMKVLDTGKCTFEGSSLICEGVSATVTDDADVVVYITGIGNYQTNKNNIQRCMVTSEWIGASDVPRFTRKETGESCDISYAVVEFTGSNWAVQRIAHPFTSAASQTETITDVGDISRAFFHVQQRNTGGTSYDGLCQAGAEVRLTATNTITYDLSRSTSNWGANMDSVVWVVSNSQTENYPLKVTHYNPAVRAGGGSEEDNWQDTITTLTYDINESAIGGLTSQSTGCGNAYPRGFISAKITGANTIDLYQSDSGQRQNYAYQIIEWPTAPAVDNNITGDESTNSGGGAQSALETQMVITNSNGNDIFSNTGNSHSFSIGRGIHDISIRPSTGKIKRIFFERYDVKGNINQIVDIDTTLAKGRFDKMFAINPKLENFTNATVTVEATSETLYKCKDWNYANQACDGVWDLFKTDLIPGQEYTFIITPDDPGFGEINITGAQHLNENYSFISDIYNETITLDSVWSEKINHSDMVRVVFEENLTSINHIKMYIRNVASSDTKVNVYAKNGSFLIGETSRITSPGYYRVDLTNMSGENDTFDLQVINSGSDTNAYLEFDHIVDPNEVPNVDLASPANDSSYVSGISEVNLSVDIIDDLLPLDNVTTMIFGGRDVAAANNDLLFIGNITNGSSANYSWRYQPFDVDSDTLIGYHFDGREDIGETSTLVYDWAGNNNGTLKKQAFINNSNDIFGGHLELDGSGGSTSDRVSGGTFPDIENKNSDLSIMVWVRPDVSQGKFIFTQGAFQTAGGNKYYGYFVAQDGADLIVVHGNGETSVTGANSARAANFFTSMGEWVHVGIVRESDGSYEFFKDGASFGTSTNTNTIFDTGANIAVGDDANPTNPSGANTNFNGGIDDLIVVNRSLTSDEIANISKMGDGTYYWYASGNDSTYANTTAMNQFTIGVDTEPNADLNAPANNSVYNSTGNIIFNTTVSDSEGTNLTVRIYVTNGTSGVSLNSDDLVYYNGNITNGSDVAYNLTAPILDLDDDYLLLAHFDNNGDYAENETLVYNFVGGNSGNGTVKGDAVISKEEGLIAGALNSSGSDGSFVRFGDRDDWIGKKNISYVGWVNPRDLTRDEGIFSKHTGVVGGDGFAIHKNSDDLKISIDGDVNTVSNFFVVDTWTHIVVVLNDTYASIYQDGEYNQSFSYTSITTNDKVARIGGSHITTGISFNGLIDEFAIINRSLTASEVSDTYQLKSGTHYWKVNVTDTAGNSNESETYQFILDRPPTLASVTLDPSAPNITVPLNCSFIPNDDLASTVDYTVKFYNESILDSTSTGSATVGSSFSVTSPAYNHKHFDNWSCSVEITDDYDNSSGVITTSALEILNIVPYPPSLLSPESDYSSTNNTVVFVWKPDNSSGQLQPSDYVGCSGFFCYENTSDLDSDNVTFLLNITCYDGGTICDDTHYIEINENVTNCDSNSNDLYDSSDNCSYSKDLTYFNDDGVSYNWTVDVKDPYDTGSEQYGASSLGTGFTITLDILAGMTMLTNTVNFNHLAVNTNNDTSGCDLNTFSPSPCPLLIENAGNRRLNVNVTPPADSFWNSVAYPHSIDYFSIKAGPGREGTAYTAIGTNTTYVAFSEASIPQKLIKEFKYGDSNDEVRIDINITSPLNEPMGNKSSILTFTGFYVPIEPIPLP